MKLQLPKSADIKNIEFFTTREDAAKLSSDFGEINHHGHRVIEINNSDYAILNLNFDIESPLSASDIGVFKIVGEPKVKVNIELHKIEGENNE